MPLKRLMKEGTSLEPGTYKIRLTDLKEDLIENARYGTGDVIRFLMETTDVLDEDSNPVQLDGIADDKLTQMSKLTRWLNAFGVAAIPGEEVDMLNAIGREAMAVIVNKPGKDGNGKFPRVEDLVPLPKGSKPTVATPVKVNGNGSAASEADLDNFWKRVKAGGFGREEVAPYVDGDLARMVEQTPDDLAKILVDMGV